MKSIILCLVLNAVLSFESDAQNLYLTTFKRITENGKELSKTDSLWVYDQLYFEVELSSYKNDSARWYEAKKNLASGFIKGTNRVSVSFIKITDDKKKPIKFSEAAEFLNWMDKHGYSMVSEQLNKYGGVYKFKKE